METKTFEEVLNEKGYLYWKTVGISMRPLIKEGRDTVLIKKRPSGALKKYDAVLFRRPGVTGRGAYILHRIIKVNNDGTYWIVGDNLTSGDVVPDEHVIGVLDTVVRKGKRISSKSFKYRLYVHLWWDFYPVRFALRKIRSKSHGIVKKFLGILGVKKYK